MGHDKNLNERIRKSLKGIRGITERNMFGGLCFMHNGNMLCGADEKNGLMVRVGPEQYEKTLKMKHAREMKLTGKPMKGLIFVSKEGYKNKPSLDRWLARGIAFTRTLPKK